ncbi:MAG: hypothetical protein GEU96_03130 [Propionibacteriales bacterium]|nr:hypothetical protein [Propionibacteriales bacterium]
MPSELQRVAQGLVDCLDQVPGVVAHLQRTAGWCRQQAAWLAESAPTSPDARAAALQLDAAARACEEAAHQAALARAKGHGWAQSMVDGTHHATLPARTTGSRRAESGDRLPSRPPGFPPVVWERIVDGIRFNREDGKNYVLNEIRLVTGKIMDSYVHRREIVERKMSQLAAISDETAKGYLSSIDRKYSAGKIIADTPRNRSVCPNLIGRPTIGLVILKVPVQDRPIPDSVLNRANELDIQIRDTEGTRYTDG